jgi:hypothetical protein
MLMLAATAMAQPAGGNGNGNGNGGFGGGGGRRGRGGGDPAAFQAQQLDTIRQDLGASDDEWKVLMPKVQAVMTARTEVQQGQGRGGGRRGGGGLGGNGGGGQAAATEVSRALQELRDLLNNESATADQILAKLTNLRNARTKAEANLAAARKDLKELLTARQEAILVTLGYMD